MSRLSSWLGSLFGKTVIQQVEHFGEEILKYFIPDLTAEVQAAAKVAIDAANTQTPAGADWITKLKFASDSMVAQFPAVSRAVINSAINDTYLAAMSTAASAPAGTFVAKAAAAIASV